MEYVLINIEHFVRPSKARACLRSSRDFRRFHHRSWVPLFVQDKRSWQNKLHRSRGEEIVYIAIQLAKHEGMKVITGDSKEGKISERGADDVTKKTSRGVIYLTDNQGVGVALDTTYNASSFVQAAQVLKPGGKRCPTGNT